MGNILDQLGITNNGQLPTVNVQVQVDNNSILKLAAVTFLVGLFLIVISKYAHK